MPQSAHLFEVGGDGRFVVSHRKRPELRYFQRAYGGPLVVGGQIVMHRFQARHDFADNEFGQIFPVVAQYGLQRTV